MKTVFSLLIKFFIPLGLLFVGSQAMAQEVSDEAKRHMIRGEAALEMAETEADFQDAVNEFKKATEFAPNWPNGWYNLGVAQELAGDLPGAIASYRKYLELNPEATDRAEVETQIVRLEYRHEQAEKERLAAERQRQADEYLARRLVGIWQNPRHWYWADNRKKKKCENMVRGYRIQITAVGNSITGTVIGTPTTHYDTKRCQTWYTSTNVPYFKAKVINGRLVGTINVVAYGSEGAWIHETEPLDIGISMSSNGYSFKEIHLDQEPAWNHEWLKE